MHPRDSCVKGGADSLSLSLQYLDHKARETMKGAAMQPPLPDPSQWVLGSGFMSLLGVSLSFHFRGLDFSLSQLIKIPSQGCQPWITGCSDKSLPGEGGGLELLSEGLGPSRSPLGDGHCGKRTVSAPAQPRRGFIRNRKVGVTQG